MSGDGDLKVNVDQWGVEWTTELPATEDSKESSNFKVGDIECCLRVDNTNKRYELALFVDYLKSPFQVTAYLSRGADLFMPQTTTVEKQDFYSDIWISEVSEVSKFVTKISDAERVCCFRVVFHVGREAHKNSEHKSVQTPTYIDPKFQLQKLSVDFAQLLDGGDSSADVEVVCGDRTWKAHRTVLSCRSDVLRAMLHSDMLEGKTGRVQVRDAEADLFGQFLRHLYSGELPELTVDTAMRLYEIGDQYSVAGIKESCSSFLTDNLTRDNACAILSLAERHSDQAFRQSVIAYVLEQKIPLCKEYWPDFCDSHPKLANEIYDQFVQILISK